MNPILRTLGDCLTLYLALSVDAILIAGIVLILGKPLKRIMSARGLLTMLAVPVFWIHLLVPGKYALLDLREWFSADFHTLRLYLPVRISAAIEGVPDVGGADVLTWATVAWLAVAVMLLAGRLIRKIRFLRWIEGNQRECPASMSALLAAQVDEIDRGILPADIRLIHVPGLPSPCAFTMPRATIVLDRLDYDEEALRLILRHEAAHILSGHPTALAMMGIVRRLFWFNPIWILMERWCARQAELAADERALAPDAPSPERVRYARLLADLAESNPHPGLALRLRAGAKYVRQRVEAVLRPRRRPLTVTLTIMMLALSLALPLFIVPGQTLSHRFSNQTELLACLGGDARALQRGLNPMEQTSGSFSVLLDGTRVACENDGGIIRCLTSILPAESQEERARAQSCLDEWTSLLLQQFGAPTQTRSVPWPVMDERGTVSAQVTMWNVRITEEARQNLGLPSRDAALTLAWTSGREPLREGRFTHRLILTLSPRDL